MQGVVLVTVMGLGTGDTFSETSSAINWRPGATACNDNGDTTVTRPPDSPCRVQI